MVEDSSKGDAARIAVVIATAYRPADVERAVRSALESRFSRFEVVVVDQSADAETRVGLAPLMADARVRHAAMQRRGLSAALNHGAATTEAELLAITGDDCTMRPDWLDAIARAFDSDPRVAVVFGHVASAPCDPAHGFVPGCHIDEPFTATVLEDLHRMSGTSACMGVRRSVWRDLGGFDEMLGVGAPLRSGEDLDLALRALHAGLRVLQTPEVVVTHHTALAWHERAKVVRRNWYGSGAVMAKWLRLAGVPMVRALGRLSRRWVAGGSGVAATYGPRPARGAMLVGFMTGFAVGLTWPIDRRQQRFRRE